MTKQPPPYVSFLGLICAPDIIFVPLTYPDWVGKKRSGGDIAEIRILPSSNSFHVIQIINSRGYTGHTPLYNKRLILVRYVTVSRIYVRERKK